jgi:hypothetical protein
MVADRQSRFTFLAADLLSAAQPSPTPLPKTRVGVFHRHASGRLSRRGRSRSMFMPGSRTCGYKTASGLGKWLNRDPIEEWGGYNLYEMTDNNPVNEFDPLGLDGAAAAAAWGEGLDWAGGAELAGGGPEDPAADAAALAALLAGAAAAGYEALQPTVCEMGHNKPRPSTYDKHTKPRAGGPEKKDPRMQQPPPPRGPKPPPPPKPPEYFKGPKQKNN